MTRIDSPSNPRIVAAVRAAARGESLLLEGRRMIEDAIDAGVRIDEVFSLTDADEPWLSSLPRVTRVSDRVLRTLSDLPSTRDVVALAAPLHRPLSSLGASASSIYLFLDDVQDPANVGAIVRSAEAFGVAAALLTPGCAQPFSPRALRASAGSAFRLPLLTGVSPLEMAAWAEAHGVLLAGAEARGGTDPASLSSLRPLALVIGSEGHGISDALEEALSHRVTLPLAGRVESLNAAVAAGVLLHLLTR